MNTLIDLFTEPFAPDEIVLWELLPWGAGGFFGRRLANLSEQGDGSFSGDAIAKGTGTFFRVYNKGNLWFAGTLGGTTADLQMDAAVRPHDELVIRADFGMPLT